MDTEALSLKARQLISERLAALGASDLESYIHARLYSDWLASGASRPSFNEYVLRELGK